jgi:hypothetical protein
MKPERLATLLIVLSLSLHGHIAFAGQGCCSTHGGVAGCVGAKLECSDGTLSPTCSCQDGAISSPLRAQDGVALLERTPPDVQPYDKLMTGPLPDGGISEQSRSRGKGKWTCTASCNVEGDSSCPPRVSGGPVSASDQPTACKEAKREAGHSVPEGGHCRTRHCQCKCSKS